MEPHPRRGVQLSYRFILVDVIASSLFPRIPLGTSSGSGAFRGTPRPPHLEYLYYPWGELL